MSSKAPCPAENLGDLLLVEQRVGVCRRRQTARSRSHFRSGSSTHRPLSRLIRHSNNREASSPMARVGEAAVWPLRDPHADLNVAPSALFLQRKPGATRADVAESLPPPREYLAPVGDGDLAIVAIDLLEALRGDIAGS